MRGIIIALLLISPMSSFAVDDSLQKSIEIAINANKVQGERIKLIAENMANEYSTSETPGGDPYRRKILIPKNKYDKKKRAFLLGVKKYSEDKKTPFEWRYDPSHPSADAMGYVKMPNVKRVIEMTDASEAQRAYEANVGVIEMSRGLIAKSLDAMR